MVYINRSISAFSLCTFGLVFPLFSLQYFALVRDVMMNLGVFAVSGRHWSCTHTEIFFLDGVDKVLAASNSEYCIVAICGYADMRRL